AQASCRNSADKRSRPRRATAGSRWRWFIVSLYCSVCLCIRLDFIFSSILSSVGLGGGVRDRLLEIGELLATRRAKLLQLVGILFRLLDLSGFDVELAEIFERAFVLRIEIERLAIEREGLLLIAGLAQTEAHQIVDVGMLVFVQHRRQLRERALV